MVGNPRRSLLVLTLALVAAAGCAGRPAVKPVPRTEIAASWISPHRGADNIDSLAFWPERMWLVATAKVTDLLVVHDAATGAFIRTAGGSGRSLGQLDRPNGVAIASDLAFVVERDNRRVQVLRLPDFESAGVFGDGELRRPYGLAVAGGPNAFRVWVTDNYETPVGAAPPDSELGMRVKEYVVTASAAGVRARLLRAFGDTRGDGVLRVVESIAVDPERGRLLVADESESSRGIKVYDLEGSFVGKVMGRGRFAAEPEGIQLLPCGDGGYWVSTDQRVQRTDFHVFSRGSLEHLGTFAGHTVANTDGIAVTTMPLGPFLEGAVFAVDDDARVAAFSWSAVREALALGRPCAGNAAAPAPAAAAGG
jgi:3-phytase